MALDGTVFYFASFATISQLLEVDENIYITGIGKNISERKEGDRDVKGLKEGIMNENTKEIILR
jgi:hypothetical protein